MAGSLFPGCGLTLDYSPPDPDDAGMDALVVACSDDAMCDDGLRCTTDGCVGGACVHVSSCPGTTECIARGGGECRRPCTTATAADDCDDSLDCTDDTCEADGHCAHTSTCTDPGRPMCLEGGACTPSVCHADAECDDGDPCNGTETCDETSTRCSPGTPMVCDAPIGCVHFECDSDAGGCVRVPHAEECSSGECLVGTCLPTGECSEPVPDDTRCDDGTLCTNDGCGATGMCLHQDVICDQACAADGSMIMCDDATGTCPYDTACGDALVCTAEGCVSPMACTGSDDCAGTDPDGCPLGCASGTCGPIVCPDGIGECGVLQRIPDTGCPALAADTSCQYVPFDGACTSPFHGVVGRCNDMFECEYACPTSGSCVTYDFDPSSGCVPAAFDSDLCVTLGGTIPIDDCSRWVCTGAAGNGCERQLQNANCNDGVSCTDDVCTSSGGPGGRCVRTPVHERCNDGAACTADSCEPALARDGTTGCRYVANDAICRTASATFDCAEVFCVGEGAPTLMLGGSTFPSGCVASFLPCDGSMRGDGGFVSVDSGVIFSDDASFGRPDGSIDASSSFRDASGSTGGASLVCDPLTGMCRLGAPCFSDPMCNDGNACNGIEVCSGGFCTQSAPTTCGPRGICGGYCRDGICAMSAGPACVGLSAD